MYIYIVHIRHNRYVCTHYSEDENMLCTVRKSGTYTSCSCALWRKLAQEKSVRAYGYLSTCQPLLEQILTQ